MKSAEIWVREKGIEMIRLNSGFVQPEAYEFYRAIGSVYPSLFHVANFTQKLYYMTNFYLDVQV